MSGQGPEATSIFTVTASWKSASHTQRFCSAFEEARIPGASLIIVNNDPDERNETEALRRDGVTVVHEKQNIGYAGALNEGIGIALEAGADYLLLINNDTWFEQDFLQRLSRCRDRNALYSPVILEGGTGRVQNTGGRISIPLGGAFSLNRKARYEDLKRVPPHYLSGCCLYLHRNVIEKVGLFDTSYHSYCEDVDYCYRARRMGISLVPVWELKLWHHHSASTGADPARKVYLLARNTILLAKRHIPRPGREVFIAACIARGMFQNAGRATFSAFLRGTAEGLSGS